MTLNLHLFCYFLRYLLRSVSFVAGERNDCLVASSFTLLSISMSFSFALALISASLSSSSNHRAKNNWTRDDWCVLPKRKERSARTRTKFRTTVLFVETFVFNNQTPWWRWKMNAHTVSCRLLVSKIDELLFLRLIWLDNFHPNIPSIEYVMLSSQILFLRLLKATCAHVCSLYARFQNTIINWAKILIRTVYSD